jgi:hypothetical protein
MFNRSDGVQRFHLGGVIEQRTKFSRDPCVLPRTAIANSTHCLSSIPSWRIVALGTQPTNLCANMLRRGKSCT